MFSEKQEQDPQTSGQPSFGAVGDVSSVGGGKGSPVSGDRRDSGSSDDCSSLVRSSAGLSPVGSSGGSRSSVNGSSAASGGAFAPSSAKVTPTLTASGATSGDATPHSLSLSSNATQASVRTAAPTASSSLASSNATQASGSPWNKNFPGVAVHRNLLACGIVLVQAAHRVEDVSIDEQQPSSNWFSFNDRKFAVRENNEGLKTVESRRLLKNLQRYSSDSDGLFNPILNRHCVAIPHRREEVYFPVSITTNTKRGQSPQPQSRNFYLKASFGGNAPPIREDEQGKTLDDEFLGFRRFVTAVCMRGANLRGIDQFGGSQPLIKHAGSYHNGQYIELVEYDPSAFNFYEEVLKLQFAQLQSIIQSTGIRDKKPELYVHLPAVDYLVFAIAELYGNGRITFKALESLAKNLQIATKEYIKLLKTHFSDIAELKIISPFEAITGKLDEESAVFYQGSLVTVLFQRLGLTIPSAKEETQRAHTEAEIVERLVVLVAPEDAVSRLEIVATWRDFLAIADGPIKKTNDLLGLGNAVVVASTARCMPNASVCSVVPLSEHQIQVSVDKEIKKQQHSYPTRYQRRALRDKMHGVEEPHPQQLLLAKDVFRSQTKFLEEHNRLGKESSEKDGPTYATIVGLTVIDSVVCYASNKCRGSPFYFSDQSSGFSGFFRSGIFREASENVVRPKTSRHGETSELGGSASLFSGRPTPAGPPCSNKQDSQSPQPSSSVGAAAPARSS